MNKVWKWKYGPEPGKVLGDKAIEYGLIVALIAIALIASASLVGEELEETFNKAGEELQQD